MLGIIQIIVLSLVQGITEFLPISSSAHLILIPTIFHWPDQGLAFDVAMHLGTLFSVLLYFRNDIKKLIIAFYHSLIGKGLTLEAKMAWGIVFATIPVGICGLLFKEFIESSLRSSMLIACSTILFGILLWLADMFSRRIRNVEHLNWQDVLTIGFCQALSLIPGTSRSGITLTAGLARGLTRQSAARFAFLLSIPVILLAASFHLVKLIPEKESIQWSAMGLGILISALCGYFCIHYFLKLLTKVGVLPFVIYRLFLGGLLFYMI